MSPSPKEIPLTAMDPVGCCGSHYATAALMEAGQFKIGVLSYSVIHLRASMVC